jgi:hypothetical protein
MSTCSIHNGSFLESNYLFHKESNLQETLLSVDNPEILQRTESQDNEELKRTRNRLAQRKHRQRKLCAELVLDTRRHTYLIYVLTRKEGRRTRQLR